MGVGITGNHLHIQCFLGDNTLFNNKISNERCSQFKILKKSPRENEFLFLFENQIKREVKISKYRWVTYHLIILIRLLYNSSRKKPQRLAGTLPTFRPRQSRTNWSSYLLCSGFFGYVTLSMRDGWTWFGNTTFIADGSMCGISLSFITNKSTSLWDATPVRWIPVMTEFSLIMLDILQLTIQET